MDDDLSRAPLAGSDRLVDSRFAERFRKFCKPRSRGRKDAQRILISQIRSVWRFRVGHDNKVACRRKSEVRSQNAEGEQISCSALGIQLQAPGLSVC